MLKKIYRSFRKSPGEFIGAGIVLIFVGPIWLLLTALVYMWGLVGMLLRFPNPKRIPAVVTDDSLSSEKKAYEYRKAFRKEVPDARIAAGPDQSFRIDNEHAQVEIWRDEYSVGISIDGLNSGYWNTDEEENLDLYFWIAVGALRNGITWKRNRFGRKEGWIYSDEMEVWTVVSAGNGMTSYVTYKRRSK